MQPTQLESTPTLLKKIPAGFQLTNWNADVDVATCLAAVPATATIKGVFPAVILEQLKKNNCSRIGLEEYHAFGDYPVREYMEFLVDAAQKLYPGAPLAQGLRSLGHLAYSSFLNSLVGRVLLGVLGKKVDAILRVSPRAWSAAISVGNLVIEDVREQEAYLQAKDLYYFLETYCVGIAEGMLLTCQRKGVVAYQKNSPYNARVFIAWE